MNNTSQSPTQIIIDAWRQGRPIVPFLGAGVSLAAGFPTRSRLTAYLAKVQFSLDRALYRSRYPMVSEAVETATERYRRRPADFIADFGWPEIGQLNADIWNWIAHPEDRDKRYARTNHDPRGGFKTQDDIIQSVLRHRLRQAEPRVVQALDKRDVWSAADLYGDWAALLEHLTEGQLDLIDSLFAGLDHARQPTQGQLYLTFLTQLMGIPVILSTNFDTLLEQAMRREGLTPRVFDIHRDADLPHIGLVRNQFSLVKLHGSAYGLRFGERLQYSLDAEARNRICGYVPDEALLVVLGFSGFERRMMQAIAHVAKRATTTSGTIQVLWLSTSAPADRSPFVEHIIEELQAYGLSRSFVSQTICDANSFLTELAFSVGSSFPAFHYKYDTLMSRPALSTAASARQRDPFVSLKSPGIVILTDVEPRRMLAEAETGVGPSSWSSLAAAELVSRHRDRDVIWIDLNNHHTVEAVIRDLLGQIRRIDPESPQLVLPTEPSAPSLNQGDQGLVKPVERVREAFQRGRYLVVFDCLESFARPQTVHHGLPRLPEASIESSGIFAARVQRLCDFLCMLVGVGEADPGRLQPPLYDTIVVLSVTAPVARHVSREPVRARANPFVRTIRRALRTLLVEQLVPARMTARTPRSSPRLFHLSLTRKQLPQHQCTSMSDAHDATAAKILKSVHDYRDSHDSGKWLTLFVDAVALRTELRSAYEAAEPDLRGSLALLSILSFFRRPRPLPFVRSLIARWLFDPGDLEGRYVMAAAFASIDRTLDRLRSEHAVELFEGAHIWLPRQLCEPMYEFLTAVLHLRRLPDRLSDDASWIASFVAALMASTWHLQAARVYFADVYLSSHDEQAFFEYLYHRISGLRYLAVLQALLDSCPGGPDTVNRRLAMCEASLTDTHRDRAPAYEPRAPESTSTVEPRDQVGAGRVVPGEPIVSSNAADNASLLCNLVARQYPRLATLLHGFGAFSFVRRDQRLAHALETQGDVTSAESVPADLSRCALSWATYHCRRHCIETLYNAFVREQGRISATTIPDAWLGWIDRIVTTEIAEMGGKWSLFKAGGRLPAAFQLPDLQDPPTLSVVADSIDHWCKVLSREVTQLKLRLLRGKLDYAASAATAAAQIGAILAEHTGADAALITNDLLTWTPTTTGSAPAAWVTTRELLSTEPPTRTRDANYLLRCWCEFGRATGGQGNVAVTQSVLSGLRALVFTGGRWKGIGPRRTIRHVTYDVLKVESDLGLHALPMWRYFDNAAIDQKEWRRRQKQFQRVEKGTHETEDFVRTTAESAVEYALGRAHSLTVRARALYLRGQCREAHRVLTLALSDVGDNLDRERFTRAIAHLFRAELLAISSDVHLRQSRDVLPSIRKIETALENLDSATRWLEPAANRPMWWLHLYIGRAQVRHEQLLLEIRRLAEGKAPPTWTYAQRSLWLEQCALDGLRALRLALDTLPFVEMKRSTLPSPIIMMEDKVLALWIQLFVALFGYNHLLLTRLQVPFLVVRQSMPSAWYEYYMWTRRMIQHVNSERVGPLATLITPQGFWAVKWQSWCMLQQFYHFSTDPCHFALTGDRVSKEFENCDGLVGSRLGVNSARTFREDLVDVESRLIQDLKLHECLWQQRRKITLPNG
jgi:hypothetical protein